MRGAICNWRFVVIVARRRLRRSACLILLETHAQKKEARPMWQYQLSLKEERKVDAARDIHDGFCTCAYMYMHNDTAGNALVRRIHHPRAECLGILHPTPPLARPPQSRARSWPLPSGGLALMLDAGAPQPVVQATPVTLPLLGHVIDLPNRDAAALAMRVLKLSQARAWDEGAVNVASSPVPDPRPPPWSAPQRRRPRC